MKTLKEQMALIQSLNVMDDIFFQKVAEDLEVCEEILQIILEKPKLKVIECQVQRFLRNNGAHSVILDALCELDDGSFANIEMQKADDDDHQRRVRFNQSNIDTVFTEKGIEYKELPDTYMIFISKFDIFERGRTIYHIDRVIRETGDIVDNGVYEVYVNLAVDDGTAIAELMQYFKTSVGTNEKFGKLCSRVEYFKQEREGVKVMATLFEQYVAEERAEEQKKGIKSTVKTYRKFDQSYETAKAAVLEEYPDIAENIVDEIIEEVYELVN